MAVVVIPAVTEAPTMPTSNSVNVVIPPVNHGVVAAPPTTTSGPPVQSGYPS
jgi:hypothetical protein